MEQVPFESQRDIADASGPLTRWLFQHAKRDRYFDLVTGSDSPFIHKFVIQRRGALDRRVECEYCFILGICFFGDQWPGQIQFAARPAVIRTESAHVVE